MNIETSEYDKEQEVIALLKACNTGDTECDHGQADRILCNFLTSLGYEKIVEEYDQVPKWYA